MHLWFQICYWFVGMIIFAVYRLVKGKSWSAPAVPEHGIENAAYEETKEMQ